MNNHSGNGRDNNKNYWADIDKKGESKNNCKKREGKFINNCFFEKEDQKYLQYSNQTFLLKNHLFLRMA